jgi:hypothetical protein
VAGLLAEARTGQSEDACDELMTSAGVSLNVEELCG